MATPNDNQRNELLRILRLTEISSKNTELLTKRLAVSEAKRDKAAKVASDAEKKRKYFVERVEESGDEQLSKKALDAIKNDAKEKQVVFETIQKHFQTLQKFVETIKEENNNNSINYK